jgi:hypothetical protein
MIQSFAQFNEQREKEVFFTFGRFNPPTTGHQKLMDKIASVAKGKDYKIYASNSVDSKKNPLQYKEKVTFMRKMFPKHARSIMISPKIKTAIDIAVELHNQGYNKITMVVGGDRIKEFDSLLKKYNGVKARHGFYDFPNGIDVVSAGERDPDATDVTGMSASKMRAAAAEGDFKSFQNGLPKGYSDGVKLFNTLRKRMGMKEVNDFREHIQLDKVSDIREQYARGEIFNIGDKVYNKDNKIVTISERKPNYVVSKIGKKYWIEDLTEVRKTAQDKDVKDKKGTQPKKYYSGIKSKSTKSKRDAHFKKGAKMDDDNPAAYKPAPGDARAKTKPSKHTKKFKQMFGEDVILERLITFANKAYPQQGHVVILAGGAGSGKGFVLDNLIGIEGKVFNVDDLKSAVMKTPKIIKKIKDDLNIDMSKMNLTKGEDVAQLHDIVANELNIANKQQVAFFSNVLFQRDDLKPNVIFDVTLKDLRKLQNITRLVQSVGYQPKNTHIVWVINDIEVAKKQNLDPKRGRVVPVEILVNTHRGAQQTMLDIMKMGKTLKKYMDGDIVFTFNKYKVDGDLEMSGRGGSTLKDPQFFYAKKSGQPPKPVSKLGKDVLNKIVDYVPGGQSWTIEEGVKSFKETYGEFGTDELTKKYKETTPGEVEEGKKKKPESWEKGYERRVVKTTKPEHKKKGYNWRIKGKERPEVTIKLYKEKPSFAQFKKQMKRVAGWEFGG